MSSSAFEFNKQHHSDRWEDGPRTPPSSDLYDTDIGGEQTGGQHEASSFEAISEPSVSKIEQLYRSLHDHWYIRIMLLLTVFLHTRHHLSFRACGLLLFVIQAIFRALGLLEQDEDPPATLKTLLHRLNMDDHFQVWPICYKCRNLFPPDISRDELCSECEVKLFKPITRSIWQQIAGKDAPLPPPTPYLGAPIQLLSSLLQELLAQGEVEDEIEAWKYDDQESDLLKHISTGHYWKTARGKDKKLFFDKNLPNNELRVGVTYGLDW